MVCEREESDKINEEMSTLKRNVLFNYINTITGLLFPIITFPYASRILLPEGIGIVNFQLSIINYIVLFTSLGIPLYAVKEIARCRENIEERNKTTLEILLLSFYLCIIGYVIVYFLGTFIPQINAHVQLFYVLSLTILFSGIGVNWFYQGIEDFKYITIRAVVVRIIAASSLFLFVKDEKDLITYGIITVGTTVGNNFINFIHLRKYIPYSSIFKYKLNITRHLKPALRIFILNLIISIYVNLNTIMLGFIDNEYAVGIYTAGNKIPHIILSIVSSIGVVLLPRCSNLVAVGKIDEFAKVCRKAIRFICCLSIPFTVALILLATPIVYIFGGEDFIPAVNVVYFTAPVIIFISLSNIIGIQILYPLGKEKVVIFSTLAGAIVNFVLNIILIPIYSAIGAALATLTAELAVLLYQIVVGKQYISFNFFDSYIYRYTFLALFMAAGILFVLLFITNVWIQFLLSFIVGAIIYTIGLLMVKDEVILSILNFTRNKI